MTITKIANIITLGLTPVEDNAVNYFMEKTGGNILHEYFDHFIQTRIDTAALEQKTDVMRVFNSLTPEEQQAFLDRGMA